MVCSGQLAENAFAAIAGRLGIGSPRVLALAFLLNSRMIEVLRLGIDCFAEPMNVQRSYPRTSPAEKVDGGAQCLPDSGAP